ncbi:hypothetical protein HDU91_001947 [Kappamyces sp. JEL0680]|nr:hypothetical protein HDU91_001947 [Kappamyces sp. JEL0680]
MHQLSDASLADLLPVAKKITLALGPNAYNVLQNNGRAAHQAVDHVHFHIIPKDDHGTDRELTRAGGLGIKWDSTNPSQDELKKLADELIAKF